MREPETGMTVGMEIEYWVVDSDGEPCAGEAIIDGRTPAVERYLDAFGIDSEGYDPLSEEIAGDERIDRERGRELRLEYADRLLEDVAAL